MNLGVRKNTVQKRVERFAASLRLASGAGEQIGVESSRTEHVCLKDRENGSRQTSRVRNTSLAIAPQMNAIHQGARLQ